MSGRNVCVCGGGEMLIREMDLYFRMKLERSIVHYRAYAFDPLVILMGLRPRTSCFSSHHFDAKAFSCAINLSSDPSSNLG